MPSVRERTFGSSRAPDTTVLIGDTPANVAAARDGQARIIAVASGDFSADDLAAAGASTVLADDLRHHADRRPVLSRTGPLTPIAPRRLGGIGAGRGDHHRGIAHCEAAPHRVDCGTDTRQHLFKLVRRELAVTAVSRHLV
jgi:hypothetical protein